MRKGIFLAVTLMIVFGVLTCLHAHEFIDKTHLKDLGEFDGLKHEILGPMNIPVPESFFTEKTSFYLGNNEYHSIIEIDINQLPDSALVLKNSLEDGKPYPVVISIELPGKHFRNYIATFGKNSELLISLNNELELHSMALKNTESLKYEGNLKYLVNIISSFSFTGEFLENDKLLPLEVNQDLSSDNVLSSDSKSLDDDFETCCLDSGGKQRSLMMLDISPYTQWVCWIDIDRIRLSYFHPFSKYYGEPRCYYPTSAAIYHYPDPSWDERPLCYFTSGSGIGCFISMDRYYTLSVARDYYNNPYKVEWWDVDKYLSDDGPGRCVMTIDNTTFTFVKY